MPVAKVGPNTRRYVTEMCHHLVRFELCCTSEAGQIVWCSQCGALQAYHETHGKRNTTRTWLKPHLKAHKGPTWPGVRIK